MCNYVLNKQTNQTQIIGFISFTINVDINSLKDNYFLNKYNNFDKMNNILNENIIIMMI